MKKLLKIFIISLLIVIVAILGIVFTKQGNKFMEPYLQAELEKQIGLPVEVDIFALQYNNVKLNLTISNSLKIDVKSIFNLLTQRFDGTYTIYANNFVYEDVTLKEANINGEYKGVPNDIFVNGKGSSFDAPLSYHLRIVDGEAREIVAELKEMKFSDFLVLLKQPAFGEGKVDVNLTLPTLNTNDLQGDGGIRLKEVTLNEAVLQKVYNISLPKGTTMQGDLDAHFNGIEIDANIEIFSPLAKFNFSHITYNTKTQFITTDYTCDVANLKNIESILDTQLSGAMLLKGKMQKKEMFKLSGVTDSLGGGISYELQDNDFHASVRAVPVENMLHIMKFPKFAGGKASGDINYNLLTRKGGTTVTFGKFKFASNPMTKSLRVLFKKDPSSIIFGNTTLNADIDGDEIVYSFVAKAGKASFEIGKGLINHKKGTHKAQMKVSFGKYSMQGSIGGTLRRPYIGFNIKGFTKDQLLDNSFSGKIKKFIKKVW